MLMLWQARGGYAAVFPLFSSHNASRALPTTPTPTNNRAEYSECLPLQIVTLFHARFATGALLLAMEQALSIDSKCIRPLCVCVPPPPLPRSPCG
jgi:hypothetical protein